MSGKSAIQWTEATWNPVVGCKRVSAGCDHCYAFELHDKRHIAWRRGGWDSAPVQYHKPFSQVQLLEERLSDPLHWRKPRRVFVNSMSDLFHEAVSDQFIAQVFAVMSIARGHTFQVLTKRPERMQRLVSDDAFVSMVDRHVDAIGRKHDWICVCETDDWPLRNVWLGVSVENQQAADERIPLLLETPAAVRFLSCEPLIGEVGLGEYISPSAFHRCVLHHQRTNHPCGGCGDGADCEVCGTEWVDGEIGLHWVIVGGESGARARPMKLDWARTLIEQCRSAQVPLFVKQLGSVLAKGSRCRDGHGGDPEEWPGSLEWLRVRQFPPAREQVKAS